MTSSHINGRKRRGTLRERWQAEYENEIKDMRISDLKRKAADMKEWKRIIKQSLGVYGP